MVRVVEYESSARTWSDLCHQRSIVVRVPIVGSYLCGRGGQLRVWALGECQWLTRVSIDSVQVVALWKICLFKANRVSSNPSNWASIKVRTNRNHHLHTQLSISGYRRPLGAYTRALGVWRRLDWWLWNAVCSPPMAKPPQGPPRQLVQGANWVTQGVN